MKKIIHSALEEAPCNELLFVIYAKKGYTYNHADTRIVKGEPGEKFILANKGAGKRVMVYSPKEQEPELMYKIYDFVSDSMFRINDEINRI